MPIRRALIPILVLLAMVAGAVSLLAGPGASAQSGDDDTQAQSTQAEPEQAANEPPQATLELTIWQGVDRPLDFWISSRADDEAAWTQAELEMALQEGGGWRVGDLTVTAGEHDFDLRLWHDPAETDEDTEEIWLSARLAGELWSDYGTQQVELDQVSGTGSWNYGNVSLALPLRSPDEPDEDPEYVPVGVCPPEDQTKTYAYIYVWQRKTALDSFWITHRTASNQKWKTVKLSMSSTETEADAADADDAGENEDSDQTEEAGADEEQTWNVGDLTIAGRRGALDLRLWQDPDDLRKVWLSARSSGAGWDDYGTRQWALDRTSRSGKYWYRLQTVSVAVPDNEAAEPGRSTTNWAGWDCNSAPTANAGEDQTVNANVRVTLDGTASSDPNGDALSYAWTGPEGITLANADTDTATFTTTAAQVGQTLTFTLTVTDPGGKSASDEVEITVQRPAPVIIGGGGGGGGAPPTSPGQQAPNQAPTANAGPDQHVGPGASVEVTLDGSGSSDPDGDTLTHRWRHTGGTYDGSGSFTIGNGETPTFALPSDATLGETLIITLTVSDGKGGSDTDTVTITANNAPTVNASTDANVKRNRTIALNGSNASDTDGTISGYLWEHTDEGTYSGDRISLNSPNNLSSSYRVPSDANVGDTITFTLTVTDNHGGKGTASVTSTVINVAPRANAGADKDANRTSTVTLNGSGSSDNDGTISSYSWAKTGGTYDGNETITITNLTSPSQSASFTAPIDADIDDTLVFKLTVTDNDNGTNTNTNTNTVTITLKNAPPTVSVGDDIDATRGGDTPISVMRVDDPDGDNDEIDYDWDTGTTPLSVQILPNLTSKNLTVRVPADLPDEDMNQDWTLTLTVTDEDDDTNEDSLTLTVSNDPPTAPDAGSNQSVARGNPASLSGTASTDPDGDTVTYSWAKTSGYSKDIDITNETSLTGASFSVPTDATTNAGIVITLTASDGKGGTATDTVTITATNVAPTADAGADADANRGSIVTLDGSGSNDEHGTLSFSWAQNTTSPNCTETVTLSSTTAQKPTFTVPTACAPNSTLSFTLTVTDVDNATHSDTVAIKAKNVGPTANAGANVRARAGASVNLSGSASDVEDSTPTVAWTVSGTPTATLTNAATLTPTLVVPANAAVSTVYTVTLRVTDSDNASETDSLTVKVNNTNSGPSSAEAGEPQTVNQGATVNLSGSGSDPENDPLTYSWKKTGGSYSGTLADLSGQTPTFSAPNLTGLTSGSQSKTIVWTLTVSDSAGRTATDTVTITVQNAAPTVSISNVNLTAGNTVSLSATANDPDGSNSAIKYSWSVTKKSDGAPDASFTNTTTTTGTTGLVVPSSAWKTSPHHTYTVSVTVTDEDKAQASASTTLTVNNRPPVADLQGTASARPSETVQLNGLQSRDPDPGETATLKCWYKKTGGSYGGSITIVNDGYCSGSQFTVPSNAVSLQTIIITMTAEDTKGGTGTAQFTVTVRQ